MTSPFLSISNLSVSFKNDKTLVNVIKNISFHIDSGETLALVGESGSGKSVTALSILQLLPVSGAEYHNGSIKIDGKELIGANEKTIREIRGNQVSMIFQEPMTSLNPLHTIEKQIGEAIKLYKNVAGKKLHNKIVDLLKLVGLGDAKKRLRAYPHELSGGQRQRVMIAMALANNPSLLIADEPTTALDVTIQAQILELLKELQTKLGMSMLLITHDLSIVKEMAKRVCVMKDGKIIESSDTKTLFKSPIHDYTKILINANTSKRSESIFEASPELLKIKNLKVDFPIKKGLLRKTVDHIHAVNKVTVSLKTGKTLGVVGESGSGKTTLGLAVLRLIKSSGEIYLDGEFISDLPGHKLRPLRRKMQIVFQDPYSSLSPRMSARQIVEEGLLVQNKFQSKNDRKDFVDKVFNEVGLDPTEQNRYPHEFSGGQRQRIAIARAIILRPKLIVLDEPTSALDKSVQVQIINLLRQLQLKYKLAYLFISHDLQVIRALADDIIIMQNGRIVEQGTVNDIFGHPRESYTKSLMAAALYKKT